MAIEESYQKWRFWPVLFLAFVFAFSSPLITLATPIYFFQQGVDIKFISLLSTAITITYCFSPIAFNKISDKLGRRKSVIISVVGVAVAQSIYYFTLNPFIFLIERLLEGLVLGFFFPNLQASISDDPTIDHRKYLSRFNLSWSIAVVFGLLFGSIFLQFIGEVKYIFYISPIFLILNAFIAIFFFQGPKNLNCGSQNNMPDFKIKNSINNDKSKVLSKYYIPVIVPILLVFALAFASGNGTLLYPIRAELLGFHSSSTYLISVFSTFAQSITMYFASLLILNKLKVATIITLVGYSFLFIFFNFNENYYLFIILFLFSGLFYGIIYAAASKFFLTLNILKKTSKYSSIMESSFGFTFFTSQIFLGFMGGISIGLGYITLSLSLAVIFLITLVFIRKLKEMQSK
ncbi:MAG: MFS transporter [Candidatus Thorarchaeota archaeon]